MSIELHAGGTSDIGRLRSINQDSIQLGPDTYVVADGMGGHRGGEVASQIAVESMGAETPARGGGVASIEHLAAAVRRANGAVHVASVDDPSLAGMGTTLVGVAAIDTDDGPRLGLVNVGDSRGYLFAAGSLVQITEDHSLVQELVREGRLSAQEADVHPQKNIVTRALGVAGQIDVDTFVLVPCTGDRYLLCSDGLTNEVPDQDIADVLATVLDPDAAAERLVAMANDAGGRDNITVLIVDVADDDGVAEAAGIDPHDPRSRLVGGSTVGTDDEVLEATQEFTPLDADTLDDGALDDAALDGSSELPTGPVASVAGRADPPDGSSDADPDPTTPLHPRPDDGATDRLARLVDSLPRQAIVLVALILLGIGIAVVLSRDDDGEPPTPTTTVVTQASTTTTTESPTAETTVPGGGPDTSVATTPDPATDPGTP